MDDWNRLVGVWISADERGEAAVQLFGCGRICDGEEYVRGAYIIQYWFRGFVNPI